MEKLLEKQSGLFSIFIFNPKSGESLFGEGECSPSGKEIFAEDESENAGVFEIAFEQVGFERIFGCVDFLHRLLHFKLPTPLLPALYAVGDNLFCADFHFTSALYALEVS